ncbi:hypothetical protein C8R43DRAFT_1244931 [Mycena crocata]|nr:hypothetical protein C8R43DRAFT_1244931 [Mycena crocata]
MAWRRSLIYKEARHDASLLSLSPIIYSLFPRRKALAMVQPWSSALYNLSPAAKQFLWSNAPIPEIHVPEIRHSLAAAERKMSDLAQRIKLADAELQDVQRSDEEAQRRIERFKSSDGPELHMLEGIVAAEKARSALADRILVAETAVWDLQERAEGSTKHIAQCKSALGPLRSIPTEILSRIFVAFRDNAFDFGAGEAQIARNLGLTHVNDAVSVLRLGQICCYWRTVALGTPGLWARFLFRCNGKAQRGRAGWHVWLERAGQHPLSFSFSCPCHTGFHGIGGPRPAGSVCNSFFSKLLARRSHWKDAQLILTSAGQLEAVEDFPSLETLSLQIGYNLTPLNNFAVAPRLHDVHLSGIISTLGLPWHQITHYRGYPNPSAASNVRVWSINPNLAVCVLEDLFGNRAHQPTVITHGLQHLRCIGSLVTLDELVLPALESFRFRMDVHDVPGAANDFPPIKHLTTVTALFQRSGNSLTHLYIDDFKVECGIEEMFAAIPTLTSLTLVGPNMDDKVLTRHLFDAMSPRRRDVLLPSLRSLSITGLVVSVEFLRMVEARRSRTQEAERLETLVLLALHRREHIPAPERRLMLLKKGGMHITLDLV